MASVLWFGRVLLYLKKKKKKVHTKGSKQSLLIQVHQLSYKLNTLVLTWFAAIQEVSLVYLSLKGTQCALQLNYRTH